jgi:hypothetical protein
MLARLTLLAAAIALAGPPALAQQKKVQQNKAQKGKQAVNGPKLRHQCKVGPYEKQTRLVMETVKNKPVYLAYWSSNGPFHCSFETWPGDGRARWTDSSAGTVINLISGTMLIEKNGDKYFIHARDVDRMPYCGTFGLINGVLTVPARKGNCDWKETESEEAGKLLQEPEPAEQPKSDPFPGAQAAAVN